MSRLRWLQLAAMLSPSVLAGSLRAQTPAGSAGCTGPGCTTTAVPAPKDQSTDAAPSEGQHFAAALDGMGLISLSGSIPSHLLVGMTLSGGWDSNPDSLTQGTGSPFYFVSPYLAFQRSTPKSETLVQYQPTITGYSAMYGNQMLHVGSAQILESISDRWSMKLDARGSYGQNTIRLLGSQESVPVGDVPGTGPGAASYLSQGGNVTDASVTLGAAYQTSQRNTLELQGTNGFTRFAGYAATSSIATATVAFARELTPTMRGSAYAQNSQYYGSLSCESYGGGMGLDWSPRSSVSISFSGGPQFDAPECGAQQGFAYRLSVNKTLPAKSGIYLLSSRLPGTSYLGPGLWQDSISGGYSRQVTNAGIMRLNLEYLRSTGMGGGSYDAAYADAEYNHTLGRGLIASFTYRGYLDGSGGAYTRRNLVMFSVEWAPGLIGSLLK